MKPESIKTILRSYFKEKQQSSNNGIPSFLCELPDHLPGYDGFSCTYVGDINGMSCVFLTPEYVSGTPFHVAEDGDDKIELQSFIPKKESNDLENVQHVSAGLPWDERNVPLEPQLDELAMGVGRRLGRMADDFDLNHIAPANNQISANGNRCIQFKERIICVPATSDLVQIPIIRTRAADSVLNATWRTCDRSAKAALHYVNSQGIISFSQEDEEQTIEVEIIRRLGRINDLHFAVELYDDEGIFNTLTVYIVDYSRLQPEEQQCINNIFSRTRNISISEIVTCLREKVTCNTFKAALRCLCSNADTIPKELVLGAELLRLTVQHPPVHVTLLTNVFCEYFSYLPELEDIVHLF